MSFWQDVTPQSIAQAPDGFTQFQVGENEAYIEKVIATKSKSGNKMLDITFKNMDGAEIHHYIVDDEYKMQKLKQLYISFNIPFGNQEIGTTWLNKKGIVVCKMGEPYNGKQYPKVNFLKPIIASDKANQKSFSQDVSKDNGNNSQQWQATDFIDDIPF